MAECCHGAEVGMDSSQHHEDLAQGLPLDKDMRKKSTWTRQEFKASYLPWGLGHALERGVQIVD